MQFKKTFFSLETRTQLYLRLFMASTNLVALAAIVLGIDSISMGFRLFGAVVNLLLLLYAIRPALAPSLYFRLIPWFVLFGVVFPVWRFLAAYSAGKPIDAPLIRDAIDLLLALLFASPVLKFYEAANRAKVESVAAPK